MESKLTHILVKTLFFLLLILVPNKLFSQRVEPNRWYLKADGGVSIFFGDVKRYDYIPDWESPAEIHPMFSASFGKEISKIFSVRGQFLYGSLSGHKKSAHYHFNSDVLGGSIITDINLYYLFTGARYGDSKINIYSSLGLAYLNWDTKLYYDTPLADGTELMNASKLGALSIPGSVSIEYVINRNFSISAEGMLYFVTSDEVDAKVGGIKFDMINYNSIGITYKFKTKSKAKASKIKYELSEDIYEAKPGDPQYRTPQDDAVAAEVVNKEDQKGKDDKPIITEEKTEVVLAGIVNEDSTMTEKELKQVEDSEKFPINHELENAAIQKEIWASKTNNPWPEIEFSVQISATKVPVNIDNLHKDFRISEIIVEKYDGEWYRYSAGQYDKMWKAKELRNKLRSIEGIKDAFIVVYRNEERISLEEALNFATRQQSDNPDEYQVQNDAAKKVYPMVQLEDNIPSTGIVIGVQVLSIKNDEYPLGVFKGIYGIDKPVLISSKMPWYKIIIDGFNTYDEAVEFQYQAREKGFIDAFVVAFKDGRRISLKRLRAEQGK